MTAVFCSSLRTAPSTFSVFLTGVGLFLVSHNVFRKNNLLIQIYFKYTYSLKYINARSMTRNKTMPPPTVTAKPNVLLSFIAVLITIK